MPRTRQPAAAAIWAVSNPSRSHADDRHVFAELRLGQPEAMQGNRTQGGEGGGLKIHVVGQRGEQVARHQVVFGMDGIAPPAQATRWPTLKPSMSAPSAMIVPAEE